ncbi:alpha/beta-hydrolase [Trichodelitschia bisporula]|uniref:feruloyl esterase n=1 Tax=Trichodelitschia bisporula TaxID=703511 RepID=A0A6G1HNW8_9PEZI|nr:alpha/beta-hydrolase [Trichodelitschia bisporula]
MHFTIALFALLCAYVAADPSPGCSISAGAGEVKAGERIYDFDGRELRVHLPTTYDGRTPTGVIIALHDRGETGETMGIGTGFHDEDKNAGWVVVYPNAKEGYWTSDPMADYEPDHTRDNRSDIVRTAALLDHLGTKYCIDTRRVHVAGLGTGGGMTHLFACSPVLSTRIASVAIVGGLFFEAKPGDESVSGRAWARCRPGRRPVPLLEMHGNADVVAPYWPPEGAGDERTVKVVEWIEGWRGRNGCGEVVGGPQKSEYSDATYETEMIGGWVSEGVVFGGGAVRVAHACVGSGKEEVRGKVDLREERWLTNLHYSLRGVGHVWPRGAELQKDEVVVINKISVTPPGLPFFHATKEALKWFEAHELPEAGELKKQMAELKEERAKEEKKSGKKEEKKAKKEDGKIEKKKQAEKDVEIDEAEAEGKAEEAVHRKDEL